MKYIIQYDLRQGILKRWGYILAPILIFVIAFFMNFSHALSLNASFGELLVMIFSGSLEGFPGNAAMLIFIGCLYLTLEYPARETAGGGYQIIVRCGSKIKWWLSKCLWNFISVSIYWAVGLLTLMLLCVIFGLGTEMTVRYSVASEIMDFCFMSTFSYSAVQLFVPLIIVPFLSIFVMSLIQMTAGIFTGRIVSFIFTMFVFAISAKYMISVLPANYMMLKRSDLFLRNVLDFNKGALILLAEIAIIVMVGAVSFYKTDILGSKKNDS